MNKKRNIIIVNGYPRSGKTEFINMCLEYMKNSNSEYTYLYKSSIDSIKELALTHLGWDGNKTKESRKFLADLKKLVCQFNNYSFNELCNLYESLKEPCILFTEIREIDEIQKFKDKYKDECITILIKRNDWEDYNNDADNLCHEYDYDITIENKGGIDILKNETLELISNLTNHKE